MGRKERTMIVSDGYVLIYERAKNRIVIQLPQTLETLTNTVSMVSNRRTYLTSSEESIILQTVKAIMERKEE